MINNETFNVLHEKAKKYAYTSMDYIDYEDCKNADVLYNGDDLIFLQDKSKTPAMLYYAANDFKSILQRITPMPGGLRLHFVPREYAKKLEDLGFIEWGEFADFWNTDLQSTAARLDGVGSMEYLRHDECEAASVLSQRCRLQSRGFEGESAEWFAEWLKEDKVIVLRNDSALMGFCCVTVYNGGTTLWIRELAVDPTFQGQGAGKRLMEQAIMYGVENKAVKGFLAADILNKNAIGLYNKYDFHADTIESELQMVRE